MRPKVHLRLCVGSVLLSLPVVATSSDAVTVDALPGSSLPAAPSAAIVSTSSPTGAFGRFHATPVVRTESVPGLARKVRAAGEHDLRSASPARTGPLDASLLDDLDIPSTALAAYQVAATTMTQADPSCGVDWAVLAAIGRVETDHGRHAGAELTDDGTSRPLIRGVALNGKGPVAEIRDTDGGRLDGDKVWDRAVGPMQFLPATWGYAGVDADGDGVRDPDDLNDAALAAAVYLCASPGRLDSKAGARTALYRYNPSDAYVALVLRLAQAYRDGDLAQVPTSGTTLALEAIGPGTAATDAPPSNGDGGPPTDGDDGSGAGRTGNGGGSDDDGSKDDGTKGGEKPGQGQDRGPGGTTDAELKEPVEESPVKDGDEPDSFEPGKEPEPEPEPTDEPEPQPTDEPEPEPTDAPQPEPTDEPEPQPTDEPEPQPTDEPEPVLADVTGVLTLLEDAPTEDGGTEDQWYLDEAYVDEVPVDEVPVDDVLLDFGDEEWLTLPALADHDLDGTPETNSEELAGLLGQEVVLTLEEGTEPAVVHAVNAQPYLSRRASDAPPRPTDHPSS